MYRAMTEYYTGAEQQTLLMEDTGLPFYFSSSHAGHLSVNQNALVIKANQAILTLKFVWYQNSQMLGQ